MPLGTLRSAMACQPGAALTGNPSAPAWAVSPVRSPPETLSVQSVAVCCPPAGAEVLVEGAPVVLVGLCGVIDTGGEVVSDGAPGPAGVSAALWGRSERGGGGQ